MKKARLKLCHRPATPAFSVRFTGEPDPVRTVAWLRDLISRARAAKAERESAQSGVESAA